MKIRVATLSDAKEICKIMNAIVKTSDISASKTTTKKEKEILSLLTNRETVFVLKDENKIVGLQSLHLLAKDMPLMSHVGEVDTYLLPRYQRKGFGKKLFATTLKFAKAHNYGKVMVFVRSDNKASLAFHKNLGFKQAGIFTKQIKLRKKYVDEIALELLIK